MTPSVDGDDPMEEDRASTGRTLRRRNKKVARHLKRGANEKEKENFQKRVFRIPLHKPFEEAYYSHRLWMFFIESREKEEDIRRMFCQAREKMRRRITLKKKSNPGQFVIPCTVQGIEFPHALCNTGVSVNILPRVMADLLGLKVEPSQELFTFVDCSQKSSGGIVRDLEVQIGNALVPVDFHVLDIKLNWNSSLLLGRAFLSTVGAVCNLQTNQLCLTLIDPNAHYDHIPVKKPQTIPRRINDAGIIAACHCGAEYESDYSESIDTHPVQSIDTSHRKLTDADTEKSVDTYPDEWENDYYNHTIAAYTRQEMHTDENAKSIDMTSLPSIDTQPQQRCRKRASTDTAYYKSIDTEFNHVRDGDYSIGSWVDEHHHKSFAVEIATHTPGADEVFTDEELLNMQKRDHTDQILAEPAWERTRSIDTHHQKSIDKRPQQSIDFNNTISIDNHRIPKTTVSKKVKLDNEHLTPDVFGIFRDPNGFTKAINGRTLHVSREDIADILQTANGADNLFMHQRSKQKTTKEFYDTAEKDEYEVYRDDREFARDLDGRTIPVHTKDIKRLLERASRDEPAYICLPEHASSFTQTKLVLEIYTKDEINEMFCGVCGEHERNKEAFQMKLDGVYYPLNDSISWLTTCMEEMKQDIARIHNATDAARTPSIDRRQSQSIDTTTHRSTTSSPRRSRSTRHAPTR
ncbi:hypothetical protein F2Q70_00004015 [Brassica cretica]|uniref:Aspartic peptidase DDI1-type domain-containing protein n=1 Tax=Brassica cretica TaxID=69181 RepID=A0A8S9IUU5_BRACR|nr:hypothetical protein F2Q70_00004015 [Brassica cretica]